MNGTLKLSPEAASYALAMLMSSGDVRRSQIEKVIRQKQEQIDLLRAQLTELESINFGTNGPRPKRPLKRVGHGPSGQRLSTRTVKLRHLQGRYMGLVRYLSPADKERVKKAVKVRGLEYAIGIAEKLSDRRKAKA